MDGLKVLPLSVTMMVGPQIMAAIIFVTTRRAVRVSMAFLLGVALATTAGVAVMMGLAALLGSSLGDSSDTGSAGKIIEYVLVGLLALAAIKNWVRRELKAGRVKATSAVNGTVRAGPPVRGRRLITPSAV